MKHNNKFKKITNQTLIAAVDFSKSKHTGYFTTLNGNELKPFAFSNNREGFDTFWDKLQRFREKHQLKDVVVSFESTGSYGLPFIHFLKTKPVRMLQVNPKHTKRTKEITDNSPNKTDHKDPRVIANLIWMQKGLTVNIANGAKSNLRNYIHYRDRIQKNLNQLINQVEAYLAIYFPEFLQLFKSLQSKTALYILQHYSTPGDIAHADMNQLERELRSISRGRVDKEKTAKIVKKARTSIGVREGLSSYRLLIHKLLEQIHQLQNQKKTTERAITSELDNIPESQILLSVKGIGSMSAAAILGEMGDFRDFRTINEVTKYAGFNLYELSSGQSQSTRKITKRGRALLRKTLYFATLNMIKKGGIFYEDYHRHLNKGMPRKKAQIAIARKLLRMLFAMVRDKTWYQGKRMKQTQRAA